jgi:hypothetical protein
LNPSGLKKKSGRGFEGGGKTGRLEKRVLPFAGTVRFGKGFFKFSAKAEGKLKIQVFDGRSGKPGHGFYAVCEILFAARERKVRGLVKNKAKIRAGNGHDETEQRRAYRYRYFHLSAPV